MKQLIYLLLALLSYSTASQAQYQEGLDPSFGTKGISLTSETKPIYFGSIGITNAALQPDGKIVAIATQRVSRYKVNGELDSTFAISGIFDPSIFDDHGIELIQATYNAVTIQNDGKIIVAGFGNLIGGPILLFRITSNGFLDVSFGKNGVVCNSILGSNGAYDLTIQPDGKIIVLATQYSTDSQVLVRYHSDGQIDSSFGIYGKAVNSISGLKSLSGGDVVLLADGRIVAVGNNFGVSRYLSNGTLDTTFNHTGLFPGFTDFAAPFSRAMCVRPDGKIWVAGNPLFDNPAPFVLLRLNENGSIDSSFGGIGYKLYDWDTGGQNKCRDMLLLPDGKVVIGGWVMNRATKQDNFGLIRIRPDGREDSTFGINGRLLTQMNLTAAEGSARLYKLMLQADNKILGLGTSANTDSPTELSTIVRYYGNGKTSINENDKKGQYSFDVFPNPAKNYIQINTTQTILTITISNLQGQIIKIWDKPLKNTLDISELTNGFYVLSIQKNNQIMYQKIIIQH